MKSSIKQRLVEGKIVRAMFLGSLASPKLVEVAGLIGEVHGVWIDQEHSAVPHQQLELLLMACRAAGLDAFARVPPTDYATIMRPMEAGASGVMAAMVRSVEQVHQIVRWAKYPPLGARGLFQANYEAGYGTTDVAQHVERANRERWLAIQIETTEAVECAEAIAAVPEVDWLFVGPSDLSCVLGVPGQPLHPKSLAATARVAAACKAAGKPWGTLARSPEHAAKCRELGCQFFSLVGDMDLVHRGFLATKQMYAEFYTAAD
jgi:4-hydroxy-2-oxoheptanedioate aldolase